MNYETYSSYDCSIDILQFGQTNIDAKNTEMSFEDANCPAKMDAKNANHEYDTRQLYAKLTQNHLDNIVALIDGVDAISKSLFSCKQ